MYSTLFCVPLCIIYFNWEKVSLYFVEHISMIIIIFFVNKGTNDLFTGKSSKLLWCKDKFVNPYFLIYSTYNKIMIFKQEQFKESLKKFHK